MTDEEQAPRERDGRFAPGRSGNPDTQWGPDNPPPRSPGRPKKDAFVHELEERLEQTPDLRRALADGLIKIALKGSEQARLKALDMIQSRVGGPLKQQVEATVDHHSQPRRIYIVQTDGTIPEMPEEVLELEEARRRAEDEMQARRDQVG
jgi:hypothetical protein